MNTIDYYNEHASEFCTGTINADMSYCQGRFLEYVVPSGLILDAGCGSGRDTIAFLKAGYSVEAFDASAEICKIAEVNTGISVQCMRFENLDYHERFDGIWASASLLHVYKSDLPVVFQRLAYALKPDGILYASFKHGNPERMVHGRYFYDPTVNEIQMFLKLSNLKMLSSFITSDVRPGKSQEKWLNVICQK